MPEKINKIFLMKGCDSDSFGLRREIKMKVEFISTCFIACFIGSLALKNDPSSESMVPQITSLTMCLARVAFLDNYSIAPTSPATRRVHSTRRKRQVRCPITNPYYRTTDGECNNLKNPDWGRSFERFKRYLPPQYEDGVSMPRLRGTCRKDLISYDCLYYNRYCSYSCYRSHLPSPRLVSTEIHTPPTKPTSSVQSVMLMQWGQFLDHDLTAAAIEQPSVLTSCCSESRARIGRLHGDTFKRRGTCFTIPLFTTTRDRFFEAKCMDFIRSRPINPEMSESKPREQQNLLTAFIDASNVYGSDQETLDRLREVDGTMKTTAGGTLLPKGPDSDCILSNAPFCFAAGDERVHVFPGLTALHTLFVRFHNYIAEGFKFLTDWDAETIFQETRKIIGAFMQKITYTEFLPELFNSKTLEKYEINTPYKYDEKIDPSIASVFATAAFRFGHTLIPDSFIINKTKILTRRLFNNPEYIFYSFDQVVDNILSNSAELLDELLSIEITDHLFEFGGRSFDLASFNIQRGRDHGLPPYNDFRKFCGLPKVCNFHSAIFGSLGPKMDKLYNDIDELDVFTGLLSEKPEPGSAAGPLLACILGRQFKDLKQGDSFWYETTDKTRGFTSEQLAAIQATSFASILCNQFDRPYIQKNPFKVVSSGNPLVACDSLPYFDLSPWIPKKP